MCEPPERRDMRRYWTEGPGGEPLANPNLLHVVCCDLTAAFCGERLRGDEEEGYVERTEDCLSCLFEESRRERANLGCGSPLCPHRPLRERLPLTLRLLFWPRNRTEWALWGLLGVLLVLLAILA